MATKAKAAVPAVTEPEAPSVWSQILAEADAVYDAPAPFIFDAYDPPIEITAPDTLERSLALATLLDVEGNVEPEAMKPMLKALVGEEAFPFVWDKLRNQPVHVTHFFVNKINEHFNGESNLGARALPGGSAGS